MNGIEVGIFCYAAIRHGIIIHGGKAVLECQFSSHCLRPNSVSANVRLGIRQARHGVLSSLPNISLKH